MRGRTLVLLVLAVLLAAGTALLARSWLASERSREIAQVAATPAPAKPSRSVLVARTNIGRGQLLKPEELIWQPWPEGSIDKNYIVSGGPDTPQKFAGWVVINPISAGEPITQAKIIAPGNRGYLAAVLRPGMRAISVPVTLTSSISGLIFPGDNVDVLVTYLLPPPPGVAGGRGNQVAETVLRHVRVIGIDSELQGAPGKAFPRVQNATFEVTPKQSEIIAVANEMGKLTLALDSMVQPSDQDSDKDKTAANVGSSGGSGSSSAALSPEQQKPASGEDRLVDDPAGARPDSPVAHAATYTVDSQISTMLPDASRTVTILRGAAKSRESVDWSQLIGGEPQAAKPAGGT